MTFDETMQGHISGGFCAGASVDWLRCVLQGGAADHRPDVNLASVAYLSQVPRQREKFRADYNSKVQWQARRETRSSQVLDLTVVGASKPTSCQPNGVVALIDTILNDKRLAA